MENSSLEANKTGLTGTDKRVTSSSVQEVKPQHSILNSVSLTMLHSNTPTPELMNANKAMMALMLLANAISLQKHIQKNVTLEFSLEMEMDSDGGTAFGTVEKNN